MTVVGLELLGVEDDTVSVAGLELLEVDSFDSNSGMKICCW